MAEESGSGEDGPTVAEWGWSRRRGQSEEGSLRILVHLPQHVVASLQTLGAALMMFTRPAFMKLFRLLSGAKMRCGS
ncbi:hypothetical protein Elgi_40650 [Paenibacillus elgii]|nr:hypothetical protein Elgi_40650 [Paenibacillus elgii]